MARLAVLAKRIITPETIIQDGVVLAEDGKVVEVGRRQHINLEEAKYSVLDGRAYTLVPGFIDVHVHGSMGRDLMEATPEAVEVVSRSLAQHGTTAYLATTVTASPASTLRAVEGLGKLMNQDLPGARIVGLHLEGPFLSVKKRGVHPLEHIRKPSKVIFDELIKMSGQRVKLITLAPEVDGGMDLLQHASSRGVLVSIGHSDATFAEAISAIDSGASNATHTFNAMREFSHREPGILGAVLTDDRIWAELIADGIHVSPAAIKMLLRCKGARKIVLITDGLSATGMPDGEYDLGILRVTVADGVCRSTAEGTLAGSTLTQDRALRNMLQWTGIPLEEALFMLTQNAAAAAGVGQQKGSIEPGFDADFVLLDDQSTVEATVIQGKVEYRRG